MRSEQLKGAAYTIASALLFGVTPVLASWTYDMGSNGHTLAFYRNLLVVPVLLVLMLIKKIPFGLTRREALALFVVGVCFRASTTLMLYSSYAYIGIGTAATLHFLYPVFTALVCFVVYREKLSRTQIAALVIATAGIAFFADKTASGALPGIALAVISAFTYGCYMAGMDNTCLRDMDPTKVACYMGFSNAMALLLLDQAAHRIVFVLPPLGMLYTFILAICTSFLAVWLLQKGIERLGAPTAAIFCMFEPITSVLSGAVFLGEALTPRTLFGSALILGGVTLVAKGEPQS